MSDALRVASAPTIDALIAQSRHVAAEAIALARPLGREVFNARPAPTKWSVGEHVAHLAIATRPYLSTIDAAVADSRRRGRSGETRYRGTRLGRWFIATLEPPPRLNMKTPRRLTPPPELDPVATLADFEASHYELIDSLERARGVDLGRAHMRSPYFWPLRMTVLEGYQVVLAHDRRHLWHMHRALETAGASPIGSA